MLERIIIPLFVTPPPSRLIVALLAPAGGDWTMRLAPRSTVIPPLSVGTPLETAFPISFAFVSDALPIQNMELLLSVRLLTTSVAFFPGDHTSVFAARPSPICRFASRKPALFLSVSIVGPSSFTVPSFMFRPELPLPVELLDVVEMLRFRIRVAAALPFDVSFERPPCPLPDPPEISRSPLTVSWGAPVESNRSVGPSLVPEPVLGKLLQRACGRSIVTVTPGVVIVTSLDDEGTA